MTCATSAHMASPSVQKRRFSVGCSQRYQPTQSATLCKKAQAYRFEALHKIYFYDAWRQEPLLNAPGSDLVLPPEEGLLIQGCYWPKQTEGSPIQIESDANTEDAEGQATSLQSPGATDAAMETSETDTAISVSSEEDAHAVPGTPSEEECSQMDDCEGVTDDE